VTPTGYRDNAKWCNVARAPLRSYLPEFTACPLCGCVQNHAWAPHNATKCGEARGHTHRWCVNCQGYWIQGLYEDASWFQRQRLALAAWWETSALRVLLFSEFLVFWAIVIAVVGTVVAVTLLGGEP